MTYVGGDTYEGEWLMGRRHGQGTLTRTDGSSYTGSWVNDEQDGEGHATDASGNVFQGRFHRGRREGAGPGGRKEAVGNRPHAMAIAPKVGDKRLRPTEANTAGLTHFCEFQTLSAN